MVVTYIMLDEQRSFLPSIIKICNLANNNVHFLLLSSKLRNYWSLSALLYLSTVHLQLYFPLLEITYLIMSIL